jgi:hypothetical protein
MPDFCVCRDTGFLYAGGHKTQKVLHLRRMKMKKRLGIISVLLVAVLIAGCGSTPKATVYDKSVPLEQSSTIIISYPCSVIEFNGKSTALSPSWQAHNGGTKLMVIPAGTHTLVLYAETIVSNRKMMYSSEPIINEFLPGHTYLTMSEARVSDASFQIIDQAILSRELTPDTSRADIYPFEGVWVNIKNEEDRLVFSGNEYMVLSKTKGQMSWRGTFSHNSETVTLTVSAMVNLQGLGWMSWMGSSPTIRFIYNGTTLKGKTLLFNKDIEFRRVQ